ncbi:hypothetical protein RJ40_01790 [Methanofollis aquaemaris]|uniref:PIN domain-containing protein n=1 Tax=Methanofollis aquaemaris TaxID=126734 RepID=A0A8A3S3T3_9EURY|nr:hypothetical protein [Methanofollis aquaemaris]QSZ66320.1 hypothetical protein RJ40_01790 [Methanofollis aquaemaris]
MSEMLIASREIPALINHFGGEVVISYPIYGIRLLEARPEGTGYRISILSNPDEFYAASLRFGEHAMEMPFFSDFEECLLASGVTTYANMEAFREKAKIYRGLKKEISFGLDTNLMYHRFFTTSRALRPDEVILTGIVRQEIEYVLNHKYSARFIAELRESAPEASWYIAEFENRRKKKSRKAAYLAMPEYKTLRDRAILVDEGEKAVHATRENDQMIVEALRRFEEKRFGLPVLLTADGSMADLCDAEGVEYFLFRAPYHPKPRHASPETFFKLVAHLALSFGVVTIGSAVLFGEFGGKGDDPDAFRLTFIGDDHHTECERDIELCRKLSALGIRR